METNQKTRNRFFSLILVMAFVAVSVAAISISILYQTAFEEERARLVESTKSEARLIEAAAHFNQERYLKLDHGTVENAREATLSQVMEAHRKYQSLGTTGEYILAEFKADHIDILMRHRNDVVDRPEPIPLDSELALPMRKALAGESGSMVGIDYRGVKVLAAYEPIRTLNIGLVTKINLAEIRAPFVKASLIVGLFTAFLVLAGSGALIYISNPVIHQLADKNRALEQSNHLLEKKIEESERIGRDLRASEQNLKSLFNSMRDAILVADTDQNIIDVNPAFTKLFNYTKEELKEKKTLFIYEKEIDFLELGKVLKANRASGTILKTIRFKKKNNDIFPGETAVCKLQNSDGKIEGTICLIRDISDRIKQEAELKRNLEELERFNRLALGREKQILQLKEEINHLLKSNGKEIKYASVSCSNNHVSFNPYADC